jgi:hypothetical protein
MTFRLAIDRDNRLIWRIHRIPRPSFSGDAANTDWCGVIVPQEQAIKRHERCCTANSAVGTVQAAEQRTNALWTATIQLSFQHGDPDSILLVFIRMRWRRSILAPLAQACRGKIVPEGA